MLTFRVWWWWWGALFHSCRLQQRITDNRNCWFIKERLQSRQTAERDLDQSTKSTLSVIYLFFYILAAPTSTCKTRDSDWTGLREYPLSFPKRSKAGASLSKGESVPLHEWFHYSVLNFLWPPLNYFRLHLLYILLISFTGMTDFFSECIPWNSLVLYLGVCLWTSSYHNRLLGAFFLSAWQKQ